MASLKQETNRLTNLIDPASLSIPISRPRIKYLIDKINPHQISHQRTTNLPQELLIAGVKDPLSIERMRQAVI